MMRTFRYLFVIVLTSFLASEAFSQPNNTAFTGLSRLESFSGAWSTESSAGFTPRSAPSAAIVDGKIYVMGGYNATTYFNILEVFDPVTNSWNTPMTTGVFTARRGLSSAVVNNKIYAMGGYNGVQRLNTLEVFDPVTNVWSDPHATGTFTAREKLCASVVDGKIYAMGGFDGTTHLNTLEVFDPVLNIWSRPTTTGTFTPRRGLTSSVVNGKIYVMGGYNGTLYLNTLEVFDPAMNVWSTPSTTGTFTARGALCSGVLNGVIYTMGGVHYVSPNYIAVNTVEVFDPSTNVWSTPTTTGKFSARYELAAAMVPSATHGDKIYTFGGVNDNVYLNTNEEYSSSPSRVTTSPDIGIAQLGLSLSPNPAQTTLSVRCTSNSTTGAEPMKFALLNILGECILEQSVQSGTSMKLDLSNRERGLYFVRLSSSSGVVTKKLILQ